MPFLNNSLKRRIKKTFYEKVRDGYRDMADKETERIFLIDGDRSEKDISHSVWSVVKEKLALK